MSKEEGINRFEGTNDLFLSRISIGKVYSYESKSRVVVTYNRSYKFTSSSSSSFFTITDNKRHARSRTRSDAERLTVMVVDFTRPVSESEMKFFSSTSIRRVRMSGSRSSLLASGFGVSVRKTG